MENPIKMDDLGVPLFLETPISTHLQYCTCSLFNHLSSLAYALFRYVVMSDVSMLTQTYLHNMLSLNKTSGESA